MGIRDQCYVLPVSLHLDTPMEGQSVKNIDNKDDEHDEFDVKPMLEESVLDPHELHCVTPRYAKAVGFLA
jgi:hypothetical protein